MVSGVVSWERTEATDSGVGGVVGAGWVDIFSEGRGAVWGGGDRWMEGDQRGWADAGWWRLQGWCVRW